MPRLTDTEWRILCILVRQTYGWTLAGGTRKTSDWLSHFLIKRKTGRQSAAISRAIAVLVRSGLISVTDERGYPLYTPAMRRRSHSHLIFAIHPQVYSRSFQKRFLLSRFRNSGSENNKRNLDKRKQQQHRTDEFSTGDPFWSQTSLLEAEQEPNEGQIETGS